MKQGIYLRAIFGFCFDILILTSAGSPRSTIEAPHAFALRPSGNWTARDLFVPVASGAYRKILPGISQGKVNGVNVSVLSLLCKAPSWGLSCQVGAVDRVRHTLLFVAKLRFCFRRTTSLIGWKLDTDIILNYVYIYIYTLYMYIYIYRGNFHSQVRLPVGKLLHAGHLCSQAAVERFALASTTGGLWICGPSALSLFWKLEEIMDIAAEGS